MASKMCVAFALCMTLLVFSSPTANARELMVERTISNCKEYGIVNKERVCTRCHDDHVLVLGGKDCQRTMAGCRDVGFEGGKQVCKACKDQFVLVPGTRSCNRRVVGH